MFTFKNNSKPKMMTALAGMSLLALTLSGSALAQDRNKMMGSDRMMSDSDIPYPAPVEYPMASPGALDLYHYHSYQRNILSPGSMTDAHMNRERMMDARLHRTPIMEDPMMVDPAPWEYPIATPGGLDLYHYESYRGNRLMDGSVTEARMEKRQAREAKLRMETHISDDAEMADPAPWSYPNASPGGVDLYHYRSYERNILSPGSVTEKRERIEKKKDAKRKMDAQSTNQ